MSERLTYLRYKVRCLQKTLCFLVVPEMCSQLLHFKHLSCRQACWLSIISKKGSFPEAQPHLSQHLPSRSVLYHWVCLLISPLLSITASVPIRAWIWRSGLDLSVSTSIVFLARGTSEAHTLYASDKFCPSDRDFRHECSLTATGHALMSKQLPNQSWQAAHRQTWRFMFCKNRPMDFSEITAAQQRKSQAHIVPQMASAGVVNSAWQDIFAQIIYPSFSYKTLTCFLSKSRIFYSHLLLARGK